MPRGRLAFAASPGQPRATINAAWRRLLPVPGGAAVMTGPAFPVSGPARRCLMTPAVPSAALATIQPERSACLLHRRVQS
jgi:hypothetical protein